MDLNLSPSEEAFRQEVRSWIKQNLPPEWTVDRLETLNQREAVAYGRKWQERLGAAGWLGLAWPREYGGRGATLMQQAIYTMQAHRADAPPTVDRGIAPAWPHPDGERRSGTEGSLPRSFDKG